MIFIHKYIRIVLVISVAMLVAAGTRDKRLIGGKKPANKTQFPYAMHIHVVFLDRFAKVKDNRYCTGAILNPNWVMTTASCLSNGNLFKRALLIPASYSREFYYSNHNNTVDKHVNYLRKAIPHSEFDVGEVAGLYVHDIALIQPLYRISFTDSVNKVNISSEENVTGSCILVSFGTKKTSRPDQLFYSELDVHPVENGSYILFSSDEFSMTEHGDQGGLLVCGGRLVGLYSYSVPPEHVFTSTASYTSWIRDNSKAHVYQVTDEFEVTTYVKRKSSAASTENSIAFLIALFCCLQIA